MMRVGRMFAVAALVAISNANAPTRMRFDDVASSAGLSAATVSGDDTHKRYILEMNGSGIAFFDYDRDGYPDLFVVNGTRFDLPPGSEPPVSRLYHNNGDGTFTDVTRAAGLGFSGWGQAACVGDYDNDGYDDLFVTYYGKNRLYRNNGNGTFTEMAGPSGVAGVEGRWNAGCAFVDYDRDGKLDLFVANYVDLGLDLSHVPAPGSGQFCNYKGIPIACGPRGLKPAVNYLYHNNGDGTFADRSEIAGIRETEGHYALGVLTLDYDNDGWPDIYVACDSAPSIMYHNNRDGTFRDAGVASATAYNEDGESQAGMGVAAADYNHDGFLDIVKTNFSDDSPNLYQNNGRGVFIDRVFEAGLGRVRSFLGWGVIFQDLDNDGWSDIFMVNGHLSRDIDSGSSDSRYQQRKLFYRNLGNGRFEDLSLTAGPALSAMHSSRGAASADIRNDGRLAIAVNEMNETPSLLAVDPPASNHWIGIRTVGVRSNRDGIGARVELRAGPLLLVDEVRSGGSYNSQNDLRLHFGLGAISSVDRITIRWPSGVIDTLEKIAADRQIVVEEGSGTWREARTRSGSQPRGNRNSRVRLTPGGRN